MISKLLIISLVGSFLSLDITFINNFMISRPIVVGPILGWLLGDMKIGVEIGILFEMLWSDIIHIGAAIPVNVTMLTTLVLGCEVLMPQHGNTLTTFIILLSILMAYMFRQIELIVRSLNSKLIHKVDNNIDKGNTFYIYEAVMIGLTRFFLVNFVLLIVFIPITSQLIKALFFYLPSQIRYSLNITYMLLPILGFAVLFNNFFQKPFKDIVKSLFFRKGK